MDDNSKNIKISQGRREELTRKVTEYLENISRLMAEINEDLDDISENIFSKKDEDMLLHYKKLSMVNTKRDSLKMENSEKIKKKKLLFEALQLVESDFDKFSKEENKLMIGFLRSNEESLAPVVDTDLPTKEKLVKEIKEKVSTLEKEIENESGELALYDEEIKKDKDVAEELEKKSSEIQKKKDSEYNQKIKMIEGELEKIESLEKDMKVVTFNETSKKQIDDIRKFLSDKS